MSGYVDRETFLSNLEQSGLLSNKQFQRVLAQLPHGARSRSIARALVQAGAMTVFQAQQLLAGRSRGFFLGPYRIEDLLGQGGMGRVYKAVHRAMNRTVALKVLAPHLLQTPKAQKLFQREVQAASRLNHPNIVTAYDAGIMHGRHFLAMEFVDGPNLDVLVRGNGPLPVGQACEVIRQAAFGLQAASDHGMVHRDIKPANLLLARLKKGYKVKILDFGLARLNEHRAEDIGPGTIMVPENTVMGTPDFLSPEQSRNVHDVDVRSDLYSLGATFYFLLTGQVPFPGGSPLEKLARHGNEEPAPVQELRPGLIPAVAAIVQKLMAKDPRDRFQTPDELVEAIEPFAEETVPAWDPASHATIRFHTPEPSDSVSLQASGGLEAMLGTVPPDFSPTPFSGDDSVVPWNLGADAPAASTHARFWRLLLSLVGGACAVATALWLVMRQFDM